MEKVGYQFVPNFVLICGNFERKIEERDIDGSVRQIAERKRCVRSSFPAVAGAKTGGEMNWKRIAGKVRIFRMFICLERER